MRTRLAAALVVTLLAGLAGVIHEEEADITSTSAHREGETASRGPEDASMDPGAGHTRLPDQANDRAVEATGADGSDECVHPYPCGDEWPQGLEGPFELAEVEHVFVEMSDGVRIEGWVAHPALPAGVAAPVIMVSSPYYYTCWATPVVSGPYCYGGPNDAGWWTDPPATGPFEGLGDTVVGPGAIGEVGVAPVRVMEQGFAMAYFSVRGYANSGGCQEMMGEREQLDQAELVEWLGSQPWSNGRVAAAGLSYASMTALSAAVHAPDALKTAVTAGVVDDLYTVLSTPQGAVDSYLALVQPEYYAELSVYPNPLRPDRLVDRIGPQTERICPELADVVANETGLIARPDRNAEFWAERTLLDRLDQITAASLTLSGFQELDRITWQEDRIWEAISAPKRHVEGQWSHEWPSFVFSTGSEHSADPAWGYGFEQMLLDWYDYWLKGVGPVPDGLGTVDYEDDAGEWRRTESWPPGKAVNEALYLAGDRLAPMGEPGSRSYFTGLNPLDYTRQDPIAFAEAIGHPGVGWWAALCPSAAPRPLGAPGLVYATAPTQEPVVVAGNPHAWLHLVSDQPGGVVDVRLLDLGPDFDCDAQGRPIDTRLLAKGAIDLRFHAGNFVASDFPVGTPTPVRLDLWNLATRLEPGHRFALVLSAGEGYSKFTPLYYPTIEVVGGPGADASYLVLPVVEGTLGGAPDPEAATPRPFSPGWEPPS